MSVPKPCVKRCTGCGDVLQPDELKYGTCGLCWGQTEEALLDEDDVGRHDEHTGTCAYCGDVVYDGSDLCERCDYFSQLED